MISVIIPAYNYARFLPETLECLLKQSFTDWECIIINNGSFDNTEDVAKYYVTRDSRFKYYAIENRGVSNSRNYALQHAKGEFIQFLDADDLLEKEKLKTHYEFLKQSTETDLVYGDARYFTTENPEQRKFSMHDQDTDWMPRISASGAQLVDVILKRNIFPINAPLFRKSLVEKFGAFYEMLTGLEDWDLWLRFAVNGATFKYLKSGESDALVRVHAASASQNKKMMHSQILPVLQHYLFHKNTNARQKFYLLIRYEEELLDALFYILTGRIEKIIPAKSNSILSFLCLLMGGFLFLPFYILIKIYRKFFQ
jgi:glycosyltransferase involved in cell wall biosynthesis